MDKPSIVFMGTPTFACPALRVLAGRDDATVALVVTQPDRPAGRGRQLTSPPVKVCADELSLPVYQTASLRSVDLRAPIVEAHSTLIVVSAFGLILGRSILGLPPGGCVNLHASLLPKYRGASPVAAAILAGEKATGVTLMKMERGLDTGPMIAAIQRNIESWHTTDSLTAELGSDAATLLDRELGAMLDGTLHLAPQTGGATITRPMTKHDGAIDWSRPAQEIDRHIRAMWSWPRAFATLADGTTVQIHSAEPIATEGQGPHQAGTLVEDGIVMTGSEGIRLLRVQFPGGRPLEGHSIRTYPSLRSGTTFLSLPVSSTPPLVSTVETQDQDAQAT